MASEDRCRLTYAEGNRIKEEAAQPYVKKGAWLCAGGVLALLASLAIANVAAGLPVFMGDSFEALTDAILGGDADAVVRLARYNTVSTGGLIMSMALVFGGLALWEVGEWSARQALKEANDEKLKILERKE